MLIPCPDQDCSFIQLQGRQVPPSPCDCHPLQLCNTRPVCLYAVTLGLTSLLSCYPTCWTAHQTFPLRCPIVTSNLCVKSDCLTLPSRLVAFPPFYLHTVKLHSTNPQPQVLNPRIISSLLMSYLSSPPNCQATEFCF